MSFQEDLWASPWISVTLIKYWTLASPESRPCQRGPMERGISKCTTAASLARKQRLIRDVRKEENVIVWRSYLSDEAHVGFWRNRPVLVLLFSPSLPQLLLSSPSTPVWPLLLLVCRFNPLPFASLFLEYFLLKIETSAGGRGCSAGEKWGRQRS